VQDNNLFPVQRLVIVTKGSGNGLSLTRIRLHKNKGKRGEVKFYFIPSNSLQPKKLFGVSDAGKANEVKGEQQLAGGVNEFWICSDKNEKTEVVSFDLSTQSYQQVWADEFNADTINTANWGFENGFVRNEELQWYQPENASCNGGILTIEARREKKPNPGYVAGSNDWRKKREFIEYTATSMQTRGKQQWQYGRFELRARIDTVIGYWPAWWTLGISKRWPENGEIDIMEYYTGKVLANMAVADVNPGRAFWYSVTKPVRSFPAEWKDKFHTWRMDWDEEGIGLYMDDLLLNYQPQSKLYNRNDSTFYPFKQPHYMLINLAIGGMNGGNPQGTAFPLKYEVDYVRVSQKIKGQYKLVGTYKPALRKTK
jgi:beta-glucanase (GH16 family)